MSQQNSAYPSYEIYEIHPDGMAIFLRRHYTRYAAEQYAISYVDGHEDAKCQVRCDDEIIQTYGIVEGKVYATP